jgi:aminoglycoside 6-adenylyltransferase
MMEVPVRTMFLRMIEWYIGMKTNFTVSFGKAGRYMGQHIAPELYDEVLSTYPDGNIANIWTSLFSMAALFDKMAKEVAATMSFQYNKNEANDVTGYLKWMQTFSNTDKRT